MITLNYETLFFVIPTDCKECLSAGRQGGIYVVIRENVDLSTSLRFARDDKIGVS